MNTMLYNFGHHNPVRDIDYLYCMRIVLHEKEPTVQGVGQMLHELYAQRRFRPEMLLMAPQDLEDMSRRFVEDHEWQKDYPAMAHYFMGKADREIYPPFHGRTIKQIGGSGGTTYLYPLESLEHRVVIVGFMPLVMG